jgi:predicted TPR repeat methyltransferase
LTETTREQRLRAVYEAGSTEEVGKGYDTWASDYEADVQAFGYISPSICAALAARHIPRGDGPLLDAGAGTGIMGQLLGLLGYDRLDALDLSESMLKVAESKGVYGKLYQGALGDPLDMADGHYAGTLAVGVFTPGHAGPGSLDELLRVTRSGGTLVFTVTNPVYEAGFKAKQEGLEREGRWRLLEVTPQFAALPKEKDAPLGRAFAYRVL